MTLYYIAIGFNYVFDSTKEDEYFNKMTRFHNINTNYLTAYPTFKGVLK